MKKNSGSLREMFRAIYVNRGLIWVLTKRDIQNKYQGSILGVVWIVAVPLIMLGIYTFVFSDIFKSPWGQQEGGRIKAALLIFAGLIVFNAFSECASRAPRAIVSSANYVQKIVFPIEVLPVITMASPLFQAVISFSIWMVVYTTACGMPKSTAIYLPLVMVPLIFLMLGLSWILSALGVYLRDISQLIGLLVASLMFLSPIFYPASHFPEAYRKFLYINPLTAIIEQVRGVLLLGVPPDFYVLLIQVAASILVAWLGFYWFQMSREGFADVL